MRTCTRPDIGALLTFRVNAHSEAWSMRVSGSGGMLVGCAEKEEEEKVEEEEAEEEEKPVLKVESAHGFSA